MDNAIDKMEVEEENNFIRPPIKRTKKKPTKRLKISLKSLDTEATTPTIEKVPELPVFESSQIFLFNDDDRESLDDDALDFFSETHEEQEPVYIAFHEKLKDEEIQRKVEALDVTEQVGRREIEAVLTKQFKDKHAEAERSLEKYKQRAAGDEKVNLERLEQMYRHKLAANTKKISESMEAVRRRNREEINNSMVQHRQSAHQRRLNEAQSTAEWNDTSKRIQMKHNNIMEAFRQKSEEIKQKLEHDFKREKDKIHKTYRDKLEEADSSKQKIRQKLGSQLQQLRQRYLKRHLQKLVQERQDLMAESPSKKREAAELNTVESTDPSIPELSTDDRVDYNPPLPIQSKQPWVDELESVSGAAKRHKNRKTVMSQTLRQLSIEIHNEGIWISSVASDSDDKSKHGKTYDQEFVVWGKMAFSILDSLICGEVPPGCDRFLEKNAATAEMTASLGGQVRCSILDMRTSEATAAQMRSAAAKELRESMLNDLESKASQVSAKVGDIEKEVRRYANIEKEQSALAMAAEQKVKNAVQYQKDFRKKFHQYLGPDGTPKPTAQAVDRQKLSKAIQGCKAQVDQTTRELNARKQACAEAKLKVQKLQQDHKLAQNEYAKASAILKRKKAIAMAGLGEDSKNSRIKESLDSEQAATRVEDAIAALKKTAAHRREQVEQKKLANVSSAWIQSFQVPGALRKSLLHMLHKRKHHVILRPTSETLLNEIRSEVTYAVARKYNKSPNGMAVIESEVLKAEATCLNALHPFSEDKLPSVPPNKASVSSSHSSTSWAEPGWLLNLEVPADVGTEMILPRSKTYLVESNLAEIASAPGRQASSLLRSSRLKCLTSGLSALAKASAPAEIAGATLSEDGVAGDPMFLSEADLAKGYNFSTKQPSAKVASPSRRKSAAKQQTVHSTSAQTSTSAPKRSATEIAASSGRTAKSTPEQGKPDSKRRRSTKKTSTSTSKTCSSASKTASPRVQNSVTMRMDSTGMTKSPQPQAPKVMPMANFPQMQPPPSPQRQSQQGRPLQATPQQYSSQQMAQLRMLHQQQQQQQRFVAQSTAGQASFNPTMQQLHQFYAAGPLNHPGAMAQMHGYQARPGVPLPQQAQQQLPPGVGPSQNQGSQRGQRNPKGTK